MDDALRQINPPSDQNQLYEQLMIKGMVSPFIAMKVDQQMMSVGDAIELVQSSSA